MKLCKFSKSLFKCFFFLGNQTPSVNSTCMFFFWTIIQLLREMTRNIPYMVKTKKKNPSWPNVFLDQADHNQPHEGKALHVSWSQGAWKVGHPNAKNRSFRWFPHTCYSRYTQRQLPIGPVTGGQWYKSWGFKQRMGGFQRVLAIRDWERESGNG